MSGYHQGPRGATRRWQYQEDPRAARKLYKKLSEHFNNSVPKFYFTIQKGGSGKGKFSHFIVKERKDGTHFWSKASGNDKMWRKWVAKNYIDMELSLMTHIDDVKGELFG